MKRTLIHSGFAAALLLGLTACGDNSSSSDSTKDVTAADVQREAGQAADAATKYAGQTLSDYKQAMNAKIDALNADLESLADKAEAMAGDAKAEANDAIETLKTKRDAFVAKLSETTQDSMAAWSDLKAGLDEAWQELDAARKSAMDRYGG